MPHSEGTLSWSMVSAGTGILYPTVEISSQSLEDTASQWAQNPVLGPSHSEFERRASDITTSLVGCEGPISGAGETQASFSAQPLWLAPRVASMDAARELSSKNDTSYKVSHQEMNQAFYRHMLI